MRLKETIKIGPFNIFFSNINKEMKLPWHGHFAEVYLEFETLTTVGFPVFEAQYQQIQTELKKLTEYTLTDHTNEKVSRMLFQHFYCLKYVDADEEVFELKALTLRVRGVPDKIGHGDGFAEYRVSK